MHSLNILCFLSLVKFILECQLQDRLLVQEATPNNAQMFAVIYMWSNDQDHFVIGLILLD